MTPCDAARGRSRSCASGRRTWTRACRRRCSGSPSGSTRPRPRWPTPRTRPWGRRAPAAASRRPSRSSWRSTRYSSSVPGRRRRALPPPQPPPPRRRPRCSCRTNARPLPHTTESQRTTQPASHTSWCGRALVAFGWIYLHYFSTQCLFCFFLYFLNAHSFLEIILDAFLVRFEYGWGLDGMGLLDSVAR